MSDSNHACDISSNDSVSTDDGPATIACPTPDTRHPKPEPLVPVTEAIRYRKRAQAAEQQAGELQAKLSEMERQLAGSQQALSHLERRQKIDALLADADAVDIEVARLLTEAAVELMDEPDVALAIADLQRGKPYLFRQRSAASAGAMSARSRGEREANTTQAAQDAAASGDRRDLLQYLRLRRGGIERGLGIRA